VSLARIFIIRGPEQARALHAFLKANAAAMAQQGRPLAVEVREHKAKRSSQANRRYWTLLRFISENAFVAGRQFSDDAWHEHFRRKFIGCEDLPDGSTVGISTTTLDVGAFNDYMAQIEAYAATDLGLDMTEFA
jgi:hypothetical protein